MIAGVAIGLINVLDWQVDIFLVRNVPHLVTEVLKNVDIFYGESVAGNEFGFLNAKKSITCLLRLISLIFLGNSTGYNDQR
jgi:hypothetical protein